MNREGAKGAKAGEYGGQEGTEVGGRMSFFLGAKRRNILWIFLI